MVDRLRTLGVVASSVVVALVLPVAVLSAWAAGVVTDTDRYVATVGPLATDPVVKSAAVDQLETAALEYVDFDRQRAGLEELLRTRELSPLVARGVLALADAARVQVEHLVRRTAERVVGSPQFADAWRAANRSAHEQLVAVLEGESVAVDTDGRVTIELGTVLNTVLAELADEGLVDRSQVREVPTSFPLMKASDLSTARHAYRTIDAAGFWLPFVWLVLVVVAVLLSRRRRRHGLLLAAVAFVAMVLMGLGLDYARHRLTAGLSDPGLTGAVWDVLVARLRVGMRTILLVSAALLLVLALVGPSPAAVAVRQRAATAVTKVRTALSAPSGRRGTGVAISFLVVIALAVLSW